MQEFILPDIGEGIVECELLTWLVDEGEHIEEDQPVAEVMTDKATVQIPAMHSGVVNKLHYQAGDIAKVHAPLFAMEVDGNVSPNLENEKSVASDTIQPPIPESVIEHETGSVSNKALASPAVRRLAKEAGIDISNVVGSGKKGRVLKEDLLHFSDSPACQLENNSHSHESIKTSPSGVTRNKIERLSGIQLAMLKQMNKAWSSIPHFTVTDECELGQLLQLKRTLAPQFAQQDIKLTLLPFMLKSLSMTLHDYPILNASVTEDETHIEYHEDHNIGFAIDTPNGLVVPNIKQVQRKSIYDIAKEVQNIITAAQSNQLSVEQFTGGTITVSNIGPIGGTTATPVVNHPEVAIVALGKIQCLPRFADDNSVLQKHIMNVNWSADHRIIDGATMVKFNNAWMAYLQTPVTMLTHLR